LSIQGLIRKVILHLFKPHKSRLYCIPTKLGKSLKGIKEPLAPTHRSKTKNLKRRKLRTTPGVLKKQYSAFVLAKFKATKLRSNAFIAGPGGYRKVEGTKRKNSDKSAGRNCATMRSYGCKTR
jgi:hypothetical protein